MLGDPGDQNYRHTDRQTDRQTVVEIKGDKNFSSKPNNKTVPIGDVFEDQYMENKGSNMQEISPMKKVYIYSQTRWL